MLVLGHWGWGSYLAITRACRTAAIEGGYEVAGFLASALAIWIGARREWPDTVNTGITFFVIFLYTKFFDWWWDVMPKYLFFLVLGLAAILILLVLKRLRRAGLAGRARHEADARAAHPAGRGALILLTNAVALTGVYLNRSGEPESRLRLSASANWPALGWRGRQGEQRAGAGPQLAGPRREQRRLLRRLQPASGGTPDVAGRGAHGGAGLRYQGPAQPTSDARAALRASVAARGAAGAGTGRTGLAAGAGIRARENAARHEAARLANPGQQGVHAAKAEAGREQLERSRRSHASRLFAIDAGLDADALRRRYPDRSRHLIVRGTVRPAERGPDGDHHLAGHVSQIAIAQVNVPFALRPVLEPLRNAPSPAPDQQAPRYEVQLAIGQRLEPWIERVTTLPER
jgi:hypothetical protein